MTISLMATDDKKRMMEQAVTVLSAPAADERYRPVCDALQKGDLRQAQWTFLQLSGDTSSAVSHFLTAFFPCCHGHWQQAKEAAACACQSSRCYDELRRFCEALQTDSILFRRNRAQEQTTSAPAGDSDSNTGTAEQDTDHSAWCCEGICDCCECCNCLGDVMGSC